MKPIQKYIILTIGLSLFLLLGYIAIQNPSISQSDREVKNTNSNIDSQTNTQKPSPSLSESGNAWGGNPFKIGTTITGEGIKFESLRLEFKKPSTEWKTRTLSGITYVFGEGNPKEVMPKRSDYPTSSDLMVDYFDGSLVRPRTEQLLKEFLSNPMLVKVINQCGLLTRPRLPGMTGLEAQLPYSLYTTDLSMEGILTIDPRTGRKDYNGDKMNLLFAVLSQIRYYEHERTTDNVVTLLDCLSQDDIPAFDFLMTQYKAIMTSTFNSALENSSETSAFMSQ
ncbi:hypothetical protein K2X92_05830 [Candidatus Gracilibacteria bacterium]|nr:hypothetical protein [Candidatus Gracilibacteria bacterium]